jgi:hypothetical protein
VNQVDHTTGIAMATTASASSSARLPSPSRILFLMLAVIFVIFNTVLDPSNMTAIPLVGGAHLFVQDALLWLLFIFGLFAKLNNRRTAIASPLSKYVAFFVFIVVAESIYAVLALDRSIFTVYNDSKSFFYYLLFFPVIWCFGTDKGVEWIIKLWAVLAFFGALLYLYQFFFGELSIFQQYTWLYSSNSLEVSTGGAQAVTIDYQRILSQGTVLFRIMLFVALCMWLFPTGRYRWWWGLLTLLLAVQVLLQFTRGMYFTTALALLVMPFIVRERRVSAQIRKILLIGVFAIGGWLIYESIFSGMGTGQYSLLEFIGKRFVFGLTEMGQDTSLQTRIEDASYLFGRMEGNWLFGLGFGSGIDYGDSTIVSLWIKSGLVGTTVFFFMFFHACMRALSRYRYLVNPIHKALMLALLISTARHLVNGITQSDFTLDSRIAALIVSVALMEIIGRRGVAAKTQEASSQRWGR